MRFRFHRGSLADSMATLVEFKDDQEAREHIAGEARDYLNDPSIVADDVTSEPYSYDARIDWDTHLVCIRGYPCGFSDASINPAK